MSRITAPLWLLLLATLSCSLPAQTFLSEDFSTAIGTTAPAGWLTTTSGTSPTSWRFDNPAARAFDPPVAGNFAIADPDFAGPATLGVSTITSPPFNVNGTTLTNLNFDQQLRDLTSGWTVEVFDGSVWNVVASQANNSTANVDIGYGFVPNVVSSSYDITAAAAGATNAQLRWTYSYGYDWWWGFDNVKVVQPITVNLAMLSIDSPVNDPTSCDILTGTQPITVTFQNQGALAIAPNTLVQLDFTVNGAPGATEFVLLTTGMQPDATLSHTFTAPLVLPAPGPNSVTCIATLLGDLYPPDDAVTVNFGGVGTQGMVSTFPYLETFDSVTGVDSTVPPIGWFQDLTDGSGTGSDWFFRNTAGPTPNTSPSADHSSGTGTYAYVEDGFNFNQVSLVSPCFNLSTLGAPVLRFWLHSNNATTPATVNENFLAIDVITYPGGTLFPNVGGPLGNQGPGWGVQFVSLSPFVGQTIQLVFRGQSNGGGNLHDIAIDDVAVYDPLPTPGQAPQFGLAVLDINSATNANASPVNLGAAGPYSNALMVGSVMAFEISGQANAPIVLLAGPLTPVAATYPGVGQFDIGGAVNPATGVPASLVVIGDGFGAASSLFNAFFTTGPTGTMRMGFQIPNFPMGPLAAFQAVVALNSSPFLAISNAVDVHIN